MLCWERLNGVGASLGDLPAEQQIKRVRVNFGQFKRLHQELCQLWEFVVGIFSDVQVMFSIPFFWGF